MPPENKVCMASDKFRYQLRQEADQWQAEGLITAEQYQQLSDRYRLGTLDTSARNRFTLILMCLGGLLLGLAAITFVAANWQAWPRSLRVGMLLSLFVGVNSAGFYLWRSRPTTAEEARWQHRLGQGLLLLGALVLGANMALMAQMFQIHGPAYELWLVWGLGVSAMAYSLRLTSLGVLAALLLGCGYWQAQGGWNMPGTGSAWSQILLQNMPLVAGVLLGPLAYWCRSRIIFVLAAIAVVSSLEASLHPWLPGFWSVGYPLGEGWMAIAFVLPPALLWAYDDALWEGYNRPRQLPVTVVRPFRPLARNLAILFLSGLFYWFSFHWVWRFTTYDATARTSPTPSWALGLNVAVLLGLTLMEWFYLIQQAKSPAGRQENYSTTLALVGFLVVTALVPLGLTAGLTMDAIATFLFNVLLFLLAAGLMREGIASGQRSAFWLGMTLLTLQILSRLFEYNTDLLFKSLVLFLCGLGVIAVGLWFERYVRTLNPATAASARLRSSEEESL